MALGPARSREAFAEALHGLGERYWDRHPFHIRLHAGGCAPDEVRSWVANRWYYQRNLSQKNAGIIANCPLPEVRRRWIDRLAFQDGRPEPDQRDQRDGQDDQREGQGDGGLGDWVVLADAVGLDRAEMLDERYVLRGVRFAVDSYVNFCRTRPWWEGAAAALTELFSPDHMAARVVAWRQHYGWIKPDGFAYFAHRIPVVRNDAEYTLDLVLTHCDTRERQDAALAALAFKCDVLRAMLDAVDYHGAAAMKGGPR